MMQEYEQLGMIAPAPRPGRRFPKIRQEKRVLDFEEENGIFALFSTIAYNTGLDAVLCSAGLVDVMNPNVRRRGRKGRP